MNLMVGGVSWLSSTVVSGEAGSSGSTHSEGSMLDPNPTSIPFI